MLGEISRSAENLFKTTVFSSQAPENSCFVKIGMCNETFFSFDISVNLI